MYILRRRSLQVEKIIWENNQPISFLLLGDAYYVFPARGDLTTVGNATYISQMHAGPAGDERSSRMISLKPPDGVLCASIIIQLLVPTYSPLSRPFLFFA